MLNGRKNNVHKILCCLLSACFFTVNVFPVHAFAAESSEKQIAGYVNEQETRSISDSKVKKYERYELQPTLQQSAELSENAVASEEMDATELSTVDGIESLCEATDRYTLTGVNANTEIVEYSSDALQNYLDYCKEITSISKINDYLYVEYVSTDGMEVILAYSNDGIVEKNIYDPTTDTDVYISSEKAEMYTHFREGEHYEMPEDVSEQIDAYADAGEWDKIEEMDGITVIDCGDGCYAVEPEIDTGSVPTYDSSDVEPMSTARPTSDSELLASLKKAYPMYTGKVLTNTTKKCTSINKTVKVRVTSDRNSYKKKSANWKKFAVGTAITVIGGFLGTSVAVTTAILTGLSIGISAADTILEAVRLSKKAIYTYSGKKIGYVYDTTKYNKYVRVKTYSKTGEFTGGYDPSDKFTWLDSKDTPVHTVENKTVVDKAAYLYDRDVDTNGVCYSYYPD